MTFYKYILLAGAGASPSLLESNVLWIERVFGDNIIFQTLWLFEPGLSTQLGNRSIIINPNDVRPQIKSWQEKKL